MATLTASPKSGKSNKPFSCSIVSLTIAINDNRYSVDAIPADECGTKAFRLTKRGGDRAVHDVIRTHEGTVECSCADYEMRRREGVGDGNHTCKHGRALTELGLLAPPIGLPVAPRPVVRRVEVTAPSPVAEIDTPCCSPTEAAPCMACLPAVVEPDPATAILAAGIALAEAEAEVEVVEVVEPIDAPVEDLCAECQLPTLNDSEQASVARCICPGCVEDRQVEPFAPTEQDEADYRRYCHEQAAREHLDVYPSLPLAESLDHVTDFFSRFKNPFGELLSGVMAKLALQCRISEATDPTELAVKLDRLELDVRTQYEEIGFQNGQAAAKPVRNNIDDPGARRGRPSSGAAYGAFPQFQPSSH